MEANRIDWTWQCWFTPLGGVTSLTYLDVDLDRWQRGRGVADVDVLKITTNDIR